MSPPTPASVPSLRDVLAALDHDGARRRFRVGPVGAADGGSGSDDPAPTVDGAPWAGAGPAATDGPAGTGPTLAAWTAPGAVAARATADPVAPLGIADLGGAMAFHGPAVAVVDLVISALVVRGVVLAVDPDEVALGGEGPNVTEVVVSRSVVPTPAGTGTAGADGAARCAAVLVAILDPLVGAVVPHDPALRWGAVADLVVILAAGRARAHDLDVDATWTTAFAVVAELRRTRPHPTDPPVRLAVPVPGSAPLALARRCSCCQWHRAARSLGEASVADARCADCPSLEVAANVARLAALAAAGALVVP